MPKKAQGRNITWLDNVKGTGRLERYPLDGCRNLYVQVSPDGESKTWLFRCRVGTGGPEATITIGDYRDHAWTKDNAQSEANRLRDSCKKGIDPRRTTPIGAVVMAPKVVTLAEVWKDYLRLYVSGKSESYAKYQRYAWTKYVESKLGAMSLVDIDIPVIERFLDDVVGLKGRAIPTTQNRVHSLLSKLFTWAMRRYPKEIPIHPVKGREKHQEPVRERRMMEDEVVLFAKGYAHSTNPVKYSLLFSLLTGCRVGVTMNLDQHWITSDHLAIPEGVQGVKKCQFVITPPEAKELLQKMPLTGVTYHSLRHCFNNICKNSGIDIVIKRGGKKLSLSPHSLRKTFSSIGGDMKESDDMVDALLSHRGGKGKVNEAYLRRSIPPMVPVAARIASRIIGLMNGSIEPQSWVNDPEADLGIVHE